MGIPSVIVVPSCGDVIVDLDRSDLTSSAETAQLNITSHTLSVVTLFIAFLNLSHCP